ncbi:hypothetical protein Hanom_Chr15g01357731 [Helianthus anomalus]
MRKSQGFDSDILIRHLVRLMIWCFIYESRVITGSPLDHACPLHEPNQRLHNFRHGRPELRFGLYVYNTKNIMPCSFFYLF